MADWPIIPAGYGYPLVDMDTYRLPQPVMDALAAETTAQVETEGSDLRQAFDATIGSVTAADIAAPDGAIPTAIGRRVKVAKSVGDSVAIGDLLKASAWSSATNFLIPISVPSTIPAGSEFNLTSEGAGAGRVVPAEENLFPYPNGKAGYSGGIWVARGAGALSVAVGAGADGTDEIRNTASGSTTSGGFGLAGGAAFAAFTLASLGLKAGDVISARANLTVPSGQQGRIQIRFYTAGDVLVSEPSTTNTPGSGLKYATNVTVPAGASYFVIATYTQSSGAGDVTGISAIRFIRGSVAVSSYIDGGSTNGAWWGVANASPSSVGRVLGDAVVPAGGRSLLRYEGSGVWRVSPVGTASTVLKTTDTLAVDRDNGQPGMYAPASPFSTSDTALTSGRALWTRFVPSRDMVIQGIGFRVTTVSGTDDECCVGLYSAAGARIVTSGAVTGYLNGSAGVKVVPITATALVAGQVYYAALSAASTASVRRGTVLADAFGLAVPLVESGFQSASHPLPTTMPTFTSANISDAAVLFVLREYT